MDEKSNDGQTPLHLAASEGHVEVGSLLLSKGANVDEKDNAGLTPLAASQGHVEMGSLLLSKGARVDEKRLGLTQHNST